MDSHSKRSVWPAVVVRSAATWILVGALFKLLIGSPNDLPASVREFSSSALGLGAVLTYQLAIAIELSIASIAWLRPKLGWPLVVAQLAVFCAVLTPLALSGAKSCGCFGSKIPMPPWAMLAIDSVLLGAVLSSRPWNSASSKGRRWIGIATCCACAWAAPFALTHEASNALAGETASTQNGRAFADWRPESWVDQRLSDTALADLVAVDEHQADALWVIYRPTCGDCAEYLRRLDGEYASTPQAYVFLRLPPDAGQQVVVNVVPPGEEVVLPTGVEYVIKPPWALRVEAGVVREATQPAE